MKWHCNRFFFQYFSFSLSASYHPYSPTFYSYHDKWVNCGHFKHSNAHSAQISGGTRKNWTVTLYFSEPFHYHDNYSLLNKINVFVDIRMYVLPPDLKKAEYDQHRVDLFNISKLLQLESNQV
jgi:hypothetical protein